MTIFSAHFSPIPSPSFPRTRLSTTLSPSSHRARCPHSTHTNMTNTRRTTGKRTHDGASADIAASSDLLRSPRTPPRRALGPYNMLSRQGCSLDLGVSWPHNPARQDSADHQAPMSLSVWRDGADENDGESDDSTKTAIWKQDSSQSRSRCPTPEILRAVRSPLSSAIPTPSTTPRSTPPITLLTYFEPSKSSPPAQVPAHVSWAEQVTEWPAPATHSGSDDDASAHGADHDTTVDISDLSSEDDAAFQPSQGTLSQPALVTPQEASPSIAPAAGSFFAAMGGQTPFPGHPVASAPRSSRHHHRASRMSRLSATPQIEFEFAAVRMLNEIAERRVQVRTFWQQSADDDARAHWEAEYAGLQLQEMAQLAFTNTILSKGERYRRSFHPYQ